MVVLPRVAKIAILRQNIPISAGVESHRRNRPKGLPPREAKTAILQQTKPISVLGICHLEWPKLLALVAKTAIL